MPHPINGGASPMPCGAHGPPTLQVLSPGRFLFPGMNEEFS